ncbi:MAG: ERAP1-like C-terminal domain-containing protein [Candidatus Eisenbacteria bacterium]
MRTVPGSYRERSLWQIPVALRYPVGGGATAIERVLLGEREQVVQLPVDAPPDWVHPNADETGYYLWDVEAPVLEHLVTESDAILTPVERVGLIHDLTALLRNGELSADRFLDLTARCAGDPQSEVVEAVLDSWQSIRLPLVGSDQKDAFAVYVRAGLATAVDRWGLLPRPREEAAVSLLRPKLLLWLARDGEDARVRDLADSLTAAYLEDATACPPSLVQAVLGISARRADLALLHRFQDRFESAGPRERQIFLAAIGDVAEPEVLEEALRWSMEGELRPTERTRVAESMREEPELQARAYRWMKESYAALSQRIPGDRMANLPTFANGCSQERLDDARAFFADPSRQPAGTDVQLRKVTDDVSSCIALHDREARVAADYLSRFAQSQ